MNVFIAMMTTSYENMGFSHWFFHVVRMTDYYKISPLFPPPLNLLTFVPMNVSHVNKDRRTVAIRLGHGFWRVRCRFGYLDQVVVEDALNEAGRHDLAIDRDKAIYFLRPLKSRWARRAPCSGDGRGCSGSAPSTRSLRRVPLRCPPTALSSSTT